MAPLENWLVHRLGSGKQGMSACICRGFYTFMVSLRKAVGFNSQRGRMPGQSLTENVLIHGQILIQPDRIHLWNSNMVQWARKTRWSFPLLTQASFLPSRTITFRLGFPTSTVPLINMWGCPSTKQQPNFLKPWGPSTIAHVNISPFLVAYLNHNSFVLLFLGEVALCWRL